MGGEASSVNVLVSLMERVDKARVPGDQEAQLAGRFGGLQVAAAEPMGELDILAQVGSIAGGQIGVATATATAPQGTSNSGDDTGGALSA